MTKITLPPLPAPEYPAVRLGINRDKLAYTAEQMKERDRQIVECVVRACAEVCRRNAEDEPYGHAKFRCAHIEEEILALLPVKEPQA